MIKRICKWLCLLALATTPWTALPAKPQPRQQRVVAVGDLHGDFDAWREIALKARIINPRNRWAGGSTILVQAGDIADRGPDTLKIITHLMKLQREAARAGGRVVVLVGNHEAMNMTGDLRYVTPGEYAAFANANSARLRDSTYEANKATILAAFRAQSPAMTDEAIRAAWLAQNPLGKLEHQAAWSARGPLGKWTIANPAVARIGDSIFVHGGISVRYAAVPLDDINRRVATALAAHDDSPASILYDPFGPLWYRGLVTRKPDPANPTEPSPATIPGYPSIDDELAAVLASQGAGRLVIAHTPRLAGIEVSHGGRLVRIDTGISRYYGGKLSYLEIVNGQVVPHNFDRAPAPAR